MNTIWLEDVKIYGNSPKKLFKEIVKNRETGINKAPGAVQLGMTDLNSLRTKFKIVLMIENNLVLVSQILPGRIITTNDEIQFMGKDKIDFGSNTEKRLDIVVDSGYCYGHRNVEE